MSELFTQFINLLGAVLLLLAFAMITQRRVLSLIHLFTMQGATLVVSTAVVGYVTQQPHLYLSAAITFVLKVVVIPMLLHRVIERLNVRWDLETLINIPTTMLIGILLVIFAFNLSLPISRFSGSVAAKNKPFSIDRNAITCGTALARVIIIRNDSSTHASAIPSVPRAMEVENCEIGSARLNANTTRPMPTSIMVGMLISVSMSHFTFRRRMRRCRM